jgi:hypothetical protein
LKKLFWIALSLVLIALGIASMTVGCGPRKKFCPNTPTGDCPEGMGGNGGGGAGGDDSGSIFIDA